MAFCDRSAFSDPAVELSSLKSEYRIPKTETISNDQNSNDPNNSRIWQREYDFVFVIRAFDI